MDPLPSSFSSARDRRPSARRAQKAPPGESELQETQSTELEPEAKPEVEAAGQPPQSTTAEVLS